jgi:hypothetical protein
MADLRILSGFTSNVPSSTRGGFWFGLGSSGARVYLSSIGTPPFGSDEYIAVAVRRGILMPGDVTLAYRLLGLKCPAETAGLGTAVVFIIIGLMGTINLVTLPHLGRSLLVMSLLGIALAGLGAYRLREIFHAKRLLANWEPSAPP